MSMHLVLCVRPLTDLLPSEKLALLAFADSAEEDTKIGWPGIAAVAEWAGVSESRAKALTRALVDKGYLRKYASGHHRRRARYVVFPNGCCAEHPTPLAEDPAAPPATLEELAARLGLPLDDASRTLLQPLLDHQTKGAAHDTQPGPDGSRTQSSTSGDGYSTQHPSHPTHTPRVPPTTPNPGEGSREGTAGSTRTSGTTTSPPTPHASGAGGAVCPRHGTNPVENCRGCGTTLRQQLATQDRAAKLAAAPARDRCPAGTLWAADDSCGCPPPVQHPPRTTDLERHAS